MAQKYKTPDQNVRETANDVMRHVLEKFFLEEIQPLDPEKYTSIEVWLNEYPRPETKAKYGVLYPIENEAEGVQYDVMFSKVTGAIQGVQGGLHDITRKDTLVSVMRKGAWVFTGLENKNPNYLAEKLFIDKGSAELIIELYKNL